MPTETPTDSLARDFVAAIALEIMPNLEVVDFIRTELAGRASGEESIAYLADLRALRERRVASLWHAFADFCIEELGAEPEALAEAHYAPLAERLAEIRTWAPWPRDTAEARNMLIEEWCRISWGHSGDLDG